MSELRDLVENVTVGWTDARDGRLPAGWAAIVEAGLSMVGIDESLGGAGGEVAELVDLSYELGRLGHPTPFAEHAAANLVLARAGGPAGRFALLTVVPADGTAPAVRWGRHADQFVVVDEAGVYTAAVDPGRARSRGRQVTGEPVDVPCETDGRRPVEVDPDFAAGLFDTLVGAQIVGAIEGIYVLTRRYVATREQFGAPLVKIGSIAAKLATLKTLLVQSAAALGRARELIAADAPAARQREAALVLRVIAGDTAGSAAAIAHQLHGAIGVTEEYGLHRLTKLVWALRDAGDTSLDSAVRLGARAVGGGEPAVWDSLTAVSAGRAAQP
jgi:acyl-CoA dehydrogenase